MQTVILRVDLRLLRKQYSQVSRDVAKMSRRYKPLPLYEGLEELLASLCEHLKVRHHVLVTGVTRGGSFKSRSVR